MAGENLARLRQWTTGMDADDVNEARGAWSKGAKSLSEVRHTLKTAAENMPKGFGEGATVSESAATAFTTVADRLSDQETRMTQAAGVLVQVHTAMTRAQAAAAGAPDRPADEAPKADDFPGLPPVLNLPLALATAKHNSDVTAYNNADADAEKKISALNETYAQAIDVMKDIHGDPYIEVPEQDPVDPGPGPGPRPKGPGDPTDPDDNDDTDDQDDDTDDHDDHDDDQDPDDTDDDGDDDDTTDDEDPDDTDDQDPTGPDDDGPDDDGPDDDGPDDETRTYPGVIGGGLAAGLLGGPSAVNGIRNLVSRGGPTSGVGTIGSTTRAAGPGALGRSGVGTPGSPVARGGGAGGARGGAGGVPGSSGGRGGRGGAGGRGGVGGSGGARRAREGEKGRDDEFHDDGQDWLDDEGTGPGTLS